MELDPNILQHYNQGVERQRLTTWARLEGERTRELLRRHLPPAPATVLDIGGAEGAYALPLARAGYRVHLIDPVPRHIEAARSASAGQPDAPLVAAALGDARHLPSVPDCSVDAVLMLGPLYHLVDAADRAAALTEARRVLPPGGVLLAAAISRFASAIDGLRTATVLDPAFESIITADLDTGVHRNPDVGGKPEWFTLAYFHRPEELRAEVVQAGFRDIRVLAVEGPVHLDGADFDTAMSDPAQRATVLDTIARLEAEPSLLGASPHLMAFGVAG